MIRKWWNKKSAKDKWKIKAGIAWFGGGFGILIAIVHFFIMPKINRFIEQASPSELVELESAISNQVTWMIFIMSITIVISIIVMYFIKSENNVEEG